jgi:hypothetical protein
MVGAHSPHDGSVLIFYVQGFLKWYKLPCSVHDVPPDVVHPGCGSDKNPLQNILLACNCTCFDKRGGSLEFQKYIPDICFPLFLVLIFVRLCTMKLEDSIFISNAVRDANGDNLQKSKAECYWKGLHSGLCCSRGLRILWVTCQHSAFNLYLISFQSSNLTTRWVYPPPYVTSLLIRVT